MDRTARRVLDRRLEVGYSTQGEAAAAANIGTTTWGLMEAKGVLPKTRRLRQQVSRALRWPPHALDNLAQGLDPEATAGQPHPVAPQDLIAQRVDELTAEILDGQAVLSERLDELAAKVAKVEQLLQGWQEEGRVQ